MTFLPKAELLTIEELDRLSVVVSSGSVSGRSEAGGEPLVRREIITLVRSLSAYLQTGDLQEMTLTTNGTQLARYAEGQVPACYGGP